MSVSNGVLYSGQAPPGLTSNAEHPSGSFEMLSMILFSALVGLNVVFVLCRLVFKWRTGITVDDWFIVWAAVVGNGQTVLLLTLTKYARHGWDIPLSWIDESYMKRLVYSQTILSFASLLFAKVSILLLYLRIFSVGKTEKTVTYIIYFGIFWTCATYAPAVITTSWYCAPHIGEGWGFSVALRCRNFDIWQIVSSSMAVALDVFILVLPMPLLGRLKLNSGKKIGIALMFSTAILALACAILTTIYRVKLRGSTDPFWTSWESSIFNVIENNVAIIVACVPGTFSFIKTYLTPSRFPSLLNSPFKGLLSIKQSSTPSHSRKRSDNQNGGMGGLAPHISSPVCALSPGHLQHYKELRDVKNVQQDAFGQKAYGERELMGGSTREMRNTLEVPPKDIFVMHQRNQSEVDVGMVGIAYGSGFGSRGGKDGWREKSNDSEDHVDEMLRQMEMEQKRSRFST